MNNKKNYFSVQIFQYRITVNHSGISLYSGITKRVFALWWKSKITRCFDTWYPWNTDFPVSLNPFVSYVAVCHENRIEYRETIFGKVQSIVSR